MISSVVLILVCLFLHLVTCCRFSDYLQHINNQQEWLSYIKSDDSSDASVIFKNETLEYRRRKNETELVTKWRCIMKIQNRFFLKRRSKTGGYFYTCMGIVTRSISLLQLEWSDVSRLADPAACADDAVSLNPWILISYPTISEDFTACPIRGGFNIKHAGYFSLDVGYSRGYDIGCNLMNNPMRLEFDCIAGEGVIFDFRTSNCVPDISMHVRQRAMCVASWETDRHQFVLLRKKNVMKFWCARFPKNVSDATELYLFSDLACLDNEREDNTVKYMKFDLRTRQYSSICDDEYKECKDVSCNAFTKQECQKTCGTCNPKRPPGICSFPKRFQGTWMGSNKYGNRTIAFEGRKFSIENVGEFDCVAFDDSPLRSTKTYTTVSIFQNGCRPRFTCIKLKRLAPSALAYTLSQSLIWPLKWDNIGTNICNPERFRADSDPIRDLYRSYQDTRKPIVKISPTPKFIKCGINSSYTVRAELPDESICHGGFYQHCRDQTRLRFDFHTCNTYIRPKEDYSCVAIFRTNYWEKAILIQNVEDKGDIRCIIFNNLRPYQALVVVSDECDKMASGFVESFIRTPVMRLHIRSDLFPCKNIQLPLQDDTTSSSYQTTVMPFTSDIINVTSSSNGDDMSKLTVVLGKNVHKQKSGSFKHRLCWSTILILLLAMLTWS